MMSHFTHGNALFMFNGDWESGNLDKLMPGKVGFFLMPPVQAGRAHAAMSAPLTYGIAAGPSIRDCAAFFLNWVATNPKARQIDVQVGGSHPMGPAGALDARPSQPGTVTAATLTAGSVISEGGRRDGLHRQRDRRHLRVRLDPGAPEAVRGKGDPQRAPAAVQADYCRNWPGDR